MQLEFHDDLENAAAANVLTGQFEYHLEQPIEILDSTLREGEQPPGVMFTRDEKLEIARALDDFGMHWISVGFPPVSQEERDTARLLCEAGLRLKTAALCRVRDDDIDVCAEVGVDAISLFLGGSDSHLFDKLRLTEDEACRRIERGVERVKKTGKLCWFGIEDSARTPLPRMLRMFQAAARAGVDNVTFPDTTGVLTPTTTRRIVEILVAVLPCPVVVHFHNDLGLALANTLAALEAGAEGVHVTTNGVGERTGNTCLEELAVVLKVKYGRDLGFRLDKIHQLSQLVHRVSGTVPGAHKPVTGKWAFSHESGIHVAGLLANRESYQPYPPEIVGRRHEILFGKHSGTQGVVYLARQNGLELSDDGARAVLEKIKQRAEERKGIVEEEVILEWIREVLA